MYRGLVALLLAGLCSAAMPGHGVAGISHAVSPAADSASDRFLEVLIELRFGRMLARTIPAYRFHDEALLPLRDVFRLADYRYELTSDSSMTFILQPQNQVVEFDLRKNYIDVGGRTVPLGPDDMIRQDGMIYLATGPLGEVLGVTFLIDWQKLLVTIENPTVLPVVRNINRAARRRSMARTKVMIEPELELTASRRGVSGFVVNYSALMPSTNLVANSAFSLGVGANVMGGSLELTGRTLGSGPDRYAQFRGAWTGFWPHKPKLRQLRLGDAISTGPQPRMIRGISLTNVPFFRPPDFGFADYRGRLPQGWDIEAYRNGELVGYDSTTVDDGFSFHLPVQRGQNAVEFLAYGPYGEVRRFNQTYQIGQILLPKGNFEYGASAGACETESCQGTVNADFRYGITQRITVGGGIDSYWREQSGNLNHPYARIGGSPINALTIELGGAVNGFTRAAVRVEPSINARFLAERLDYARNVIDPIISPARTHSRTSLSAFLRPASWRRNVYFDARVDRLEREQGQTTRGRLAISAAMRNISIIPFLRVEHETLLGASNTRTFTGLNVNALPQRSLGRVFGSVTFRGGIEIEGASRVTQVGFSMLKTFQTGLRIEAGMEWNEFSQGTSFRLGIASTIGGIFASLQSVIPPSGSAATVAQLQGSAAWNPEARAFTLSPVGTFQQSGITGVVFLDENANGLRDPGEQGMPNARIIIGYSTVRSDSSGRYQAWEASPFEAAIISVDSLSLSNPLWVPLYRSISVAPGPNAFMNVDLPIVESAVIEGRVLSREGADQVGVGFVPLILTNRLTGEETSLTTFSDGEFYQMGIRPGEYELRVDETRRAGVVRVGSVVRFSVQPLPGGTTIEGIVLEIQAEAARD
jgi:hypothetical protein